MSRSSLAALAGAFAALGLHAILPAPNPTTPQGGEIAQRGEIAQGGDPTLADPLRPSGRDYSFFRPPPTENWLGPGAESSNKQARKAWMKALHRAPPEVSYEAVERVNGLAQIEKRNRISESRTAPRDSHWTERGSSNQAGRMHVALHSPDGATLWAGSSKGGIWRKPVGSTGSSWEPMGDNLYGGAHHLLVLEGNPDVVLAATDDGLVHRSVNDGATWTEPSGLPWRWGVRRMIETGGGVFLVIQEGNWEGYSVWRSQDGGTSFSLVRDLGDYVGDLWSPRTGSDDLYLLDDDDLLKSTDDGDTWSTVGTIAGSDGGELVGSEAGAPTLYAVLDDGGARSLYRSANAGASWTRKRTVEDYWGTLNASILDDDLLAWGGVEVRRSTDGGTAVSIVNEWGAYYDAPATKLHADVPGIDVVLDGAGAEIWYVSTDGGLYRSLDGLGTVQNLSLDGLRVSQYYSTLTSSANPNHIAAGSQDQGYQLSYVVGAGQAQFDQILSGDYGHLTSGDGTHSIVYACYPGFVLVQIGEDSPTLGYVDFPDDEEQAWLPPLAADPEDNEAFFFAATHLYHYTRDAGTDEWSSQRWSNQDFASEDDEYISAIAFSPVDPERAYLATNIGRSFHSDDKGVTWTRSATDGPDAHYFYGHALVASSREIDTVYLGGSGYDGPAVWRSTDGGETWDDWGQGLPSTLVYSLAEAQDGSGELFAGSENAAWQRPADGDTWTDITGADAPVTIYWSVEALGTGSTMRFGTYGRGIWDYAFDSLDPCPEGEDADGDGFTCDVDCDDDSRFVYPGAVEVCDGEDGDCDPLSPDEDDGDGDGFLGCHDDCDDGRRSVNPEADETCDGRDEDCNGLVDDDPVDGGVFHPDADGDGFGGASGTVEACEPPDGFVESADDCDDEDADIHPDAGEVCGDGRDNDCRDGDRACPANVGEGDGCEGCGASVASGGGGAWLLVLVLGLRARRRTLL